MKRAFLLFTLTILCLLMVSMGLTACDMKSTHGEHSFDKQTVIDPTCVHSGYTLEECACGETQKTNYLLPIEHTYGEFQIRKQATTYRTGLKERICTACGLIDTEVIPKEEVSFTLDTNGNYAGKIDFSTKAPEHTYVSAAISDSFIAEVNLEQKTIIVKAEDLPKDLYADLESILLDTFPTNNGNIVIGDVEVRLEDLDILIEDENGDLVAVPWESE